MDKGDKAIHARDLLNNPMMVQIIADIDNEIEGIFETVDPKDIEVIQLNVIRKQLLNNFKNVISNYIYDAAKEKPKFF